MGFNEIFEKYKNGTASEKEITLIEEEIEKNELINEYLNDDFKGKFEVSSSGSEEDIKKIKKSVNKKFNKIVFTSVASVFIILFIVFYVISPIVDSFYYSPDDVTVGDSTRDIFYDNNVITELNYPGMGALYADAKNESFGKYEVEFVRENTFTKEALQFQGEIVRNRKYSNQIMGLSVYEKSPMYIPKIQNPSGEDTELKNMDKNISYLKELSPKNYVSCYVNFKEDLTTKEFYELQQIYENQNTTSTSTNGGKISFQWAAVRTIPSGVSTNEYIGFSPRIGISSSTSDEGHKDKYKYLQLQEIIDDYSVTSASKFIGAYETHFISLLKYVCDRPRAIAAIDINEVKSEFYQGALEYVEENGVNIYGGLVYSEADTLLNFIDNGGVESIQILDVRASKYGG